MVTLLASIIMALVIIYKTDSTLPWYVTFVIIFGACKLIAS